MSNNKRCRVNAKMNNAPNCILETLTGRILRDQYVGKQTYDLSCTDSRSTVNLELLGRPMVVLGTGREHDTADQRFNLDPDFRSAKFKATPQQEHIKYVSSKTFVNFGHIHYSVIEPTGKVTKHDERWQSRLPIP